MMASVQIIDLVSSDDNKRYEPAGRMAAAIIEITQEHGGCLPQDLNIRGFTAVEVDKHWHLAKAIAAVEFRLLGKKVLWH